MLLFRRELNKTKKLKFTRAGSDTVYMFIPCDISKIIQQIRKLKNKGYQQLRRRFVLIIKYFVFI